MAVNPQYQWVSEHKIVQSTLGVITNIRPDHLDEMGSSNEQIALSLSNTIPFNSKVITAETITLEPLKKIADNRQSKLEISNSLDNFKNKCPSEKKDFISILSSSLSSS